MKHLSTFKRFLNEASVNEAVNESSDFNDYQKAITSHDWYYRMSDSGRTYDRGEDEVRNIRKIYASLDDSDKKKAFSLWAELYKKKYPDAKPTQWIEPDEFKGYV